MSWGEEAAVHTLMNNSIRCELKLQGAGKVTAFVTLREPTWQEKGGREGGIERKRGMKSTRKGERRRKGGEKVTGVGEGG